MMSMHVIAVVIVTHVWMRVLNQMDKFFSILSRITNHRIQLSMNVLRNCSNWLRDLKPSALDLFLVMAELEASPAEDCRHTGFPCFSSHKPGKQRTNQYATWMACSRCGLRLTYVTKNQAHGNDRQAMPELNLIRATMETLQSTVDAQHCTERLVNGKMMELKGQMLQAGITQTMALQMTYAEYTAKLRKSGRVSASTMLAYPKSSPPAIPPKSPPTVPASLAESPDRDTRMSAASFELVAAENEQLQERLRRAEEAVSVAKETAAQAIHRTEILAEESLKKTAEMEELRKVAAKAASVGPMLKAKQAEKPPDASEIPVSSDEEAESKKRTRADSKEASKASGTA